MRSKKPQVHLNLPIPVDDFARRVLQWYRREKRALPWRDNLDPYRVWVAEVMLQQTQVKTVIPFYQRFLNAFPSLRALARAEEDEVISLWSGLGYYSRARNLWRAARIVCDEYAGEFPTDFDAALALPGIGRYTAGAILSITHGEPYAILDGNVRRLMIRYLGLAEVDYAAAARKLWTLLERIVQSPSVRRFVSDFNQALMEIGALICKPRNPDCEACPLSEACKARRMGLQDQLPRSRQSRPLEKLHLTVAVIKRNSTYLLTKSLRDPFLKGLWEFPKVQGRPGRDLEGRFRESHGLALRVQRILDPVPHQITFRKLFLYPAVATLEKPLPPGDWVWSRIGAEGYPVSAYLKKIERRLE